MSPSPFRDLWHQLPNPPLLTGIGSLPHATVDSALAYSLRFSIPFLPQIPAKNPLEYMVPQALDGIPGLSNLGKGEIYLDFELWKKHFVDFNARLEAAFKSTDRALAPFEMFCPREEIYQCWRPFLWEIGDRKLRFVKLQISGPMTSQWSLKLSDGTPADRFPEIGMQVFKLVLARSVAMIRALIEKKTTPLLYIDEPGFYCFNKTNPRHLTGIQELKLFIQALQKEQALIGLHCCSNTDWNVILGLGLDVISLDCDLSLNLMLKHVNAVKQFLGDGGRFSLGVIPTARGAQDIEHFETELAVEKLQTDFLDAGFQPSELRTLLSASIFTPACGLALHRVEDTEIILGYQHEFAELCQNLNA